ncbi:hypothetical protein [Prolixibacter denitrificans]|uniref:PKD domain-containing protein n=1 Tax=Prolixibacter denitrificans TaxID=1541063 RepID=A0A2P8CL62_9BACT|nr:hypothetical protein [Prolixibacter denitrificans]PSK85700.1 hypothetical protein CLV93_101669 [Prolixibacter denitrificans]GET20319.1 hypothetical protein JCM18694_05650 [Prolixibacter denitrificans]
MKKTALLVSILMTLLVGASYAQSTGPQTVDVNTKYSYQPGAAATTGNTYLWTVTPTTSITDGFTLTNNDKFQAQILWKKPGIYTVKVTEKTGVNCTNYKEITVTVDNNLTINFDVAVATCADAGLSGSTTTVDGGVTVSGGTFPWNVTVTDGTTQKSFTVTESGTTGTGTNSFSYDLTNNPGGADAVKTISIVSATDANGVTPPDVSSTQELRIHQIPNTSEIQYQAL